MAWEPERMGIPGTPYLTHFPDMKMRQGNLGKKTELSKGIPGTPYLTHFPDMKMRQGNLGKKTELSKVSLEFRCPRNFRAVTVRIRVLARHESGQTSDRYFFARESVESLKRGKQMTGIDNDLPVRLSAGNR